MKNLLKLTLALSLIFLYACGGGDDDQPQIIPTAAFSQDRQVIEANEVVSFTNSSSDAVSFLWNFGDNSTSANENPTHAYATTGNYTVTLTVTSSSGNEAMVTSSVTVGNRWVTEVAIEAISFTNTNGEPWDDDGSGPELLFGFFPVGAQTFSTFVLGENLTESDLPFGGPINAQDQIMFTNQDWSFVFIDNEDPLIDPNTSEFMAGFNLNPVTIESTKDYDTGEGLFQVTLDGYNFTIGFEVR